MRILGEYSCNQRVKKDELLRWLRCSWVEAENFCVESYAAVMDETIGFINEHICKEGSSSDRRQA